MVETPSDDVRMSEPSPATPAQGRVWNISGALIVLAVAALIIVQSAALGPPGRASDPGPGGYPTLLAITLAGLALLLAFQRDQGEPVPSLRSVGTVTAVVVLVIAYAFLLRQLGYIASTALFLVGGMVLMRVRSIWTMVTVAVVVPVGLFLIFYNLFGVSLPRGTLERLLS